MNGGLIYGNRPPARHRHRWEHNIKMNLKGVWCKDVGWIHQIQDRVQTHAVVNMVMNQIVCQHDVDQLNFSIDSQSSHNNLQ
jgi:hypothetical protein